MLLRQNGCWHQKCNLFPILHRLKRRTDGNLSLTIANVTADQTIHDLRALHIFFRCLDRKVLIFRLLEWEHLLKLALPDSIRPIGKTALTLPHCV